MYMYMSHMYMWQCNKINLFLEHTFMIFSEFMELCKHHTIQFRVFPSPLKYALVLTGNQFQFLRARPPLTWFVLYWVVLSLSYKWVTWYVVFVVWLLSFSLMSYCWIVLYYTNIIRFFLLFTSWWAILSVSTFRLAWTMLLCIFKYISISLPLSALA